MFLLSSIKLNNFPDFSSKSRIDKTKILKFPQKMFLKQAKITYFSNVIYMTSKNELKLMWLSRSTNLLDSFPPKNGELKSLLCNQVTQCSHSLTVSLVSLKSTNDVPIIQGKRIMDCTRSHVSTT